MARLGWTGESVPTLAETGIRLGLTRERARQLQGKLVARLAKVRPPEMDALRRAAQTISDAKTTPHTSMGAALRDAGLLSRPMSDVGTMLLFRLLGIRALAEQYQANREELLPRLGSASRVARDLTRSVGVASVAWVIEDAAIEIEEAELRQAIAGVGWARWLNDDWYWDPGTPRGRNRLVNVTEKMLSTCGPLELHELRGGLDRVFRLGRFPHLPPLQPLRLFYADHPDFLISHNDVVSSARELDPDRVLDSTERRLYHILRDAPNGFLDRADLQRAATTAGINPNTFSVYSSYSPILDNPVIDRWVIRGSDVSPAALEAYRKQRRHRYALNEWTEQGTLRIERGTTDWNLVVSVPRPLQPYVANRSFAAVDEPGHPSGRVRWDRNGVSWGYSSFLQHADAKEGDILSAEFDLASETVVLRLRRSAAGSPDARA